MMTRSEIKAYLRRIGVGEIRPPSLEFLAELHRAHVSAVSWQTVDIVAGRPAPIDLDASVRLMLSGRSGYCFHLNGAFSVLLRSLGFRVSWHRAGVQPPGQAPGISGFHLGLTVGLTDEQGRQQRYIVDVGLGDMPFEPIPLQVGTYEQGPLRYQVERSGVAEGGWRLVHDPSASFVGVDFAPEALEDIEEFKPRHAFYSRSPESPWHRLFLVRNRHSGGSDELRGCVWSRRDADGIEKIEIRSKSQWLEVLGDVFQEHLVSYSRLERDELWKSVWKRHEEWKRERGGIE
jgi:arylamine N-acetyltransferase